MKIGDQVQMQRWEKNPGSIRLCEVVEVETYPEAVMFRLLSVPHFSENGVFQWKGMSAASPTRANWGRWDDEDLAEHTETVKIPSLVQGLKITEGDEVGICKKPGGKGPAVHANDGGKALCGAKVGKVTNKPKRWDPWVRVTKPAVTEETVWVPSFQAVTCKRCLKKKR